MHPLSDLKNKVVLVTGSSHGIGKATARLCLSLGAKIMLHGRSNQKNLELVLEEFNANSQQIGSCLVNFASEENAAQKLMQATLEKFGRVDCLINNAGIYPRNNIDTLTEELFQQVLRVNLKTPMFLIQEAVKVFRQQSIRGTVLNIGSINAYCGQQDLLVYSVSKGGLMTMTRNLGHSLGKEGIRINQLNVGWTVTETEIETRKKEGFSSDWEQRLPAALIPSGHLLRPEQVAQQAAYWISDWSAPASGMVCDFEQFPMIGRNLIPEITELAETH